MSTELSPDNEDLVERLVAQGLFADRRQALDRAVDLLRDESEVVEEIRESLTSVDRGEGTALEKAVSDLRIKHGISDKE